ncbi:MAG TPA: hypothetical protein VFO16_23795 [Pseudonocardiaceae bacterium]|nr:hypothetical protein [Pseudonocardiaceae bacterium]
MISLIDLVEWGFGWWAGVVPRPAVLAGVPRVVVDGEWYFLVAVSSGKARTLFAKAKLTADWNASPGPC